MAKRYIYVIINFILLFLIYIVFQEISILIVGLIFSLLPLVFISKNNHYLLKYIPIAVTIAFVFMIGLYFGYQAKYGVPYYAGGNDDLYFETGAQFIIDNNIYTLSQLLNTKYRFDNSNGFLIIISYLMRFCNLIGHYHSIIPRIINVYLFSTSLCLLFKMNLFGNDKKKLGLLFLFIYLFPNGLYVTVHLFRDVTNFFLIYLGMYFIYLIKQKKEWFFKKILLIALLPLLGYLCYIIRNNSVFFFLGMILFFFIINERKKRIEGSLIVASIIVFIVFVVFDVFDSLMYYNTHYQDYLLSDYSGLSGYIFKYPLFPMGWILRLIYALCFPLPLGIRYIGTMIYDVDSFSNVIISIGSFFQLLLIPFLLKSFKKFSIIHILFIIPFITIAFTTFSFRQITLYYPFMFALSISEYCNTNKKERLVINAASICVISIMLIVYLLIKGV